MKLTVIGAGNMGGAIALGVVNSGLAQASDINISDPSDNFILRMKDDGFEFNYVPDNKQAIVGSDMIILAVKPWLLQTVLEEISEVVDRNSQSIVSVAAGVSFQEMEKWLGAEAFGGISLYRVIPNTAISIGKSMTFISSKNARQSSDSMVMDIFGSLGTVMEVTENIMGAVTALSSSGIAYAMKYIEAAARGGQELGIAPQDSLEIVLETMRGAIAILECEATDPQSEIKRVTTPGGITEKGLRAMEEHGFSQAVIEGLLATK